MKRNKEKGSRDFPLFCQQSTGRWCRSCPVGTCSPLARALRRHVSSAHTHRPQTAPLALLMSFSTDPDSNLRPWRSFPLSCFSLSSHTHRPRSQHPPDSNLSLWASLSHSPSLTLWRSAPFWGVASSLRQSGADTPPSLVTVTGGF